MKNEIKHSIMKNRIITIIRNVKTEMIVSAVGALYKGGIRLIEVTFDQNDNLNDTAKQISLANEHFQDIYVGAGTVMTTEQVELAYKAGAKYIISPNVNENVIKKTLEFGMVSIPGAMTPTEISNANEFGADFVKLFPAGELGLSYIRAVLAPINHIKMLVVGGIDENNLTDFLSTGICGAGIGSNIVNKKLIEDGKFDELTELAKKYTKQL